MSPKKLGASFYQRSDVVQISRELLGKVLCTQFPGQPLTSGIITETEAYCGRNDKACHANDGLRTKRTEVMYRAGGVAYVYLCYGIHHLFNIVTNVKDKADAVLVRAVEPVNGIDSILDRRNATKLKPGITAGPGRLTQALNITTDYTGMDLTGDTIWIEDRDKTISSEQIASSPRIGVDYAGKHAQRPWRFYISESKWVSI